MISKQLKERLGFGALTFFTFLSLVPVLFIVGFLVWKGWPALTWEFFSQPPRRFLTEGGIYPAIIGTLLLTLGTVVVALPLGVGTAIYLVEYSRKNMFTSLVNLAIINLAGVPSVVYGLFGLGLFVLALGMGRSLAAGALTLGFLTLPVIISTTREALIAVPDDYRHASLALGASKWQTIRRVVLPAAAPSILTGSILGIGRAAGETAPIMFTAAVIYMPGLPKTVFDQVMALPYHLYAVSTEVPGISEHRAFGAALVLLMIVTGMNLVAVLIRTRMRLKRMR